MNRARLAGVVRYLADRVPVPEVAVVLGSGLGAVPDRLTGSRALPYGTIPGFPVPGVAGHAGRLCVGALADTSVAVLQGRVHAYEGWAPESVVLPLRALIALGARTVVVTNAAGAIRPGLRPGQLMGLCDQINATGASPLRGPDLPDFGPRFLDMTEAYDRDLRAGFRQVAEGLGIDWAEGVYAGLVGPAYETPAEIRALAHIGADAVGMSTVMEVLAARQQGCRVLGISCLTNLAAGLSGEVLSHSEVQTAAHAAQAGLSDLLHDMAARGLLAGRNDEPGEPEAGIASPVQNR